MQIFEISEKSVGDFDPTVPGCYKNVETFSFDVKPRKSLTIKISSDQPIDVAVANSDGSSVFHKSGVVSDELGPIPTGDNHDMGIFLGVYPGDKAVISLTVSMGR